MRDLISIGRFAQITQLTIKALHIYEATGLLRPAFIDTDTGYRYYSITQLPLAASEPPQLLVSAKSPVTAMLLMVSAAAPVLLSVTF